LRVPGRRGRDDPAAAAATRSRGSTLPVGSRQRFGMTSHAETALLDRDTLDQLARNTSPGVLPVILDSFVRELEQRARTLDRLLADGDLRAIGEEAHTVKGLAGTFGASRLCALAFELEQAGRAERGDIIDDIAGDFRACVERTLRCYRDRLDLE